ncbi:MAG: DUF1559 domain-containing protein [Planctomycetes bacterium]|nr:DUF1559 domain-containing protein [Planctomycetota bacterium]
MLVVITIIGMLMALLLPAINSAREAARQAVCTTNQQNLAKAIQSFATSKMRLPPSMSLAHQVAAVGDPDFSRNRVWGWVPPLLPELNHTDTYDAMLDTIGQNTAAYESIFTTLYYSEYNCPSTTRENLDQPWLSYYVNGGRANAAIAGLDDSGAYSPELFGYSTEMGTVAITRPPDWRENGAVMMRLRVIHPSTGNVVTINNQTNTLDDIHDGQSMTVLIAENCNPRGGDLGNTWSNTYIDPTGNVAIDPPQEHHNVIMWHMPGESLENGARVGINQHKDDVLDTAHARPASFHPGLVIVTFVDGHTQKISETIDYRVYSLIMTSHGRGVRNPATGASEPQIGPSWPNGGMVSEADLAL